MSWIDKLKKGLEITTGDGEKYFPLYDINPKTTEFNVAEFEFPNIEGTLVKRSMVKGTKMSLTFYFQGEDHLETSRKFEVSAKDKRAFKISHPFFGIMLVQPTSLSYDPTGLNITKIVGSFVETLSDEYPKITKDAKNQIALNVITTKEILVESLENNVEELPLIFAEFLDKINTLGELATKLKDQANEYKQLYKRALGSLDYASSMIGNAVQNAIDLYNFPAKFVSDIKERVTMFSEQMDEIFGTVEDLVTPEEKKTAEFTGGAIMLSLVESTIYPIESDYQTSNEVLETISVVLKVWEKYISKIELLQTATNDTLDSYIPDYDTIQSIYDIVNFSTANLLQIALESSSERSVILESDSNAIILAHRFYGLTDTDETLVKFIEQNNLSVDELLEIKKGKNIVYYI